MNEMNSKIGVILFTLIDREKLFFLKVWLFQLARYQHSSSICNKSRKKIQAKYSKKSLWEQKLVPGNYKFTF